MSAQPARPSWLQNAWYQAAWSKELGAEGCLERTVLGYSLVLFRDASGAPKALINRCPHRFAPLSAGRVADGIIRCGYHGLAFDGAGRCVSNPHGAITSALNVQAFTAMERHQAIWLWFGNRPADPNLLPDLSFIDETPETARITGYLPTKADYQLIADNILDLSHADYLHPSSLGGMMTGSKTRVVEQSGAITVEWMAENCVTPPAFYSMVPPPNRADVWTEVTWYAPAIMVLNTWAKPTGTERDSSCWASTLHNAVPADADSSHYFFCSTRKFKLDDAAFNAMLSEVLHRAFAEEDKPMLERQHANLRGAGFESLNPALLSIDNASARARRALARLIDAERTSPTTTER